MAKLLVISAEVSNFVPQELKKAAVEAGHELDVVDIARCIAFFNGEVHVADEEGKTTPLAKYDACIPRLNDDHILQKYHILRAIERNHTTYMVNSAYGMYICQDKLETYDSALVVFERLSAGDMKVQIPTTLVACSGEMATAAMQQLGKPPYVIKTVFGSLGSGVLMAESERSGQGVISYMLENDSIMLQQFIEHKESYRIVMLKGELLAANRRTIAENDFRTNIHQGGESDHYEPSEAEVSICKALAEEIDCHLCAVDYLLQDGTFTLLEVNGSPGLEDMQKNYPDKNLCAEVVKAMAPGAASTAEPSQATPPDIEEVPAEKAPAEEPDPAEPGSVELGLEAEVVIPRLNDIKLKAKVDTGADSSSLHGENISLKETKGTVDFTLGEKRFRMWYDRMIKVKHANADERRAIVLLDLIVDGKKVDNAEVTIADRTDMTYEFLLGKKVMIMLGATVDPSDETPPAEEKPSEEKPKEEE